MYQMGPVKDGKPCPFCGAEPVMIQEMRYPDPKWEVQIMKPLDTYRVVCSDMNCQAHFMERPYFRTREDATENWNRKI